MTVHRRGEGNADNPRQLRKLLLDGGILNILLSQHLKSHLLGVGDCLLSFVGTYHLMLDSTLLSCCLLSDRPDKEGLPLMASSGFTQHWAA